MAHFYSYTPLIAKDGPRPSVLFGAPALRKAFGDMEASMNDTEKKIQVKLTDLDDFMVYKWRGFCWRASDAVLLGQECVCLWGCSTGSCQWAFDIPGYSRPG